MRQRKLFYGSSYDRGLDILLEMWPKIHFKYPDSELHIAYGWDLFDKVTKGNAERQAWKARVIEMMKVDGVFEHGRLSKEELKKVRETCGIWVYPTYFPEINCITGLDAQKDGLVPVVSDFAALNETVRSGVKVKGDIKDKGVQGRFIDELLSVMGDKKYWESESEKAREWGNQHNWSSIANKWISEFQTTNEEPLVSVMTPTIRQGWWNIMAHNLSRQTYKNIEWVIVDDFPKDRSELAKVYARKYQLKVKYLRSKDHKVKRNYGLVNADNTGIAKAEGELLVWVQDFILLPQTGIEQLVDLYKHNPNSLLAPVDVYHAPKREPNKDSEDWFNGQLDVIGEFMRQNVRIQHTGIRRSTHPYDWELNYGAIPARIVKELGGFYEFFDFGLGFNNTELAYRAILKGYDIIVDDSNIAVCIDHWKALEGTEQHGLGREKHLNDPQYLWMKQKLESGELPLVRTQEVDDSINLTYEMPKGLDQDECVTWMKENTEKILEGWK
jgi:GT2 family glycosyltransferase